MVQRPEFRALSLFTSLDVYYLEAEGQGVGVGACGLGGAHLHAYAAGEALVYRLRVQGLQDDGTSGGVGVLHLSLVGQHIIHKYFK